MTPASGPVERTVAARPGRWGSASALTDDEEARRRLVAAAVRCIVRRGSGQIRIEEVAREAGVSRATVYRYFRSREDLVLGVMLSRLDVAMESVVRSLRRPDDAARSIPDLILAAIGLVYGDEVNEALFSADSRAMVTVVELSAEPIVEGLARHVCPLLSRWQADGQLHADLDLRQAIRWMHATAVILLNPPWMDLSPREKRGVLEQYLVRALVPQVR